MSIYDFFENIYYTISHQTHPDLVDLILNQWNLLSPGYKIIDIGAGEGKLNLELLNHIDVHFELCDIDRKKFASIPSKSSISINVTDVTELDFPGESFDVAFCINALHHFDRPKLSIKEVTRVLKKNGKLLIVDYESQALLTRIFNIIAKVQKRHRHFFTLFELTEYLKYLGLNTQSIRINHFQIAIIAGKRGD